MGREIRRVPLDFTHPLNIPYSENPLRIFRHCFECPKGDAECEVCGGEGSILNGASRTLVASVLPGFSTVTRDMVTDQKTLWEARRAWVKKEPPTGEGFQFWETTSSGSPITPVFPSLEELASFCAGKPLLPAGGVVDFETFMAMALNDHFYTDHGNGFVSI